MFKSCIMNYGEIIALIEEGFSPDFTLKAFIEYGLVNEEDNDIEVALDKENRGIGLYVDHIRPFVMTEEQLFRAENAIEYHNRYYDVKRIKEIKERIRNSYRPLLKSGDKLYYNWRDYKNGIEIN